MALLPAALLVYRLQGDRIVPAFLGEADHPWLRALIEERERFIARPRHELLARWKEPLRTASPPRKRALAAHTLEKLAVAERREGVVPRRIRSELFLAASSMYAPRAQIVAEIPEKLSLSADALEAALFDDLPDRQRVMPLARTPSPSDLAASANLALARGLLARADRVTVALEGNVLPVVRHAKLRGLIVSVDADDGGARLEISGPLSLFHHTRIYGHSLGGLVPLLGWCSRFQLEATCHLAEGAATLRLVTGDPIAPAAEPRRYDSGVEQRFARDMLRAAPAWDVIRDPQPLRAGTGLVFPDFALVHREDRSRRWLVEIVGFWTPEYLAHKLAAYRAARHPDVVLCIDERRRCAAGDLPPEARVVRYRRHVRPAEVLDAIGKPISTTLDPVDDDLLEAIRAIAAGSSYGNAFLPIIERRLGRRVALAELIALSHRGLVALNRPTHDIAVRPLGAPRPPLAVDRDTVETHIAEAISATRREGRPTIYHLVRERFDWLAPDGQDVLRPAVDLLVREGLLGFGTGGTLEVARRDLAERRGAP